ncbi:MAG: hypothetical protein ACRYGB_11340 [Janthinobacterium lividum]
MFKICGDEIVAVFIPVKTVLGKLAGMMGKILRIIPVFLWFSLKTQLKTRWLDYG